MDRDYGAFTLIKETEIEELQCRLLELIHTPTGANVIQLANDDPENFFCLSFQTEPKCSDGVAHILEHTVLCGSKKFPVKDPFFSMMRRSLNTYMNALTGSDFTCYPAATQIPKDFYNLLEIYLDAVFHPLLYPLSFKQEGHRLEFDQPDDPTSALEYKGIVYNEMKGAMANPMSRLTEEMHEGLYPDLTYRFNSGGDPKVIPELSYEELSNFHKEHYHPSRCLFFFYGDLPLKGHLDFLEKHALKGVEKLAPLPRIGIQKRLTKPVQVSVPYPVTPREGNHDNAMIAFGWLTCLASNQQEFLALCVLEIILLDTDASPLKRALLESGLCTEVFAYLEGDMHEVPIEFILKGCREDSADALEAIIFKEMQRVIDAGISEKQVEDALHQLEIYKSEIMGGNAPFGLTLFMRAALPWYHGAAVEDGLKIHSHFDKLRATILENPHYLTELLQTYFLKNPHRVRVVMRPDSDLTKREEEQERTLLETLREKLSQEQVEKLIEEAKELETFQIEHEDDDLSILPKVGLEDVPKGVRIYPLQTSTVGGMQVHHHACFTNEIVYAGILYPVPTIDEEEQSLLSLLSVIAPQFGCGGRGYVEHLGYVQAYTGGIETDLHLCIQAQDNRQTAPYFLLHGKALHRNASHLFSILRDMVQGVAFDDVSRLKEVIVKHYTVLESYLNQKSLKYAILSAASGLNVPGRINNAWAGMEYLQKLRALVKQLEENGEQVAQKLMALYAKLVRLEGPSLILSCSQKMFDSLEKEAFFGLDQIEKRPFTPWQNSMTLPEVTSHACRTSSPVAFTAQAFPTVGYTHPDAAALSIVTFLFDNLTLHQAIREKGGAYGGGASRNLLSGNFYFYALRDPNLSSTLEAFRDSVERVSRGDFTDTDLEEAKLEKIQALDTPISPGNRAFIAYSLLREGLTDTVRQHFRNQLLAVTRQEVIAAVEKHIVPQLESSTIVTFAGKDLLERENPILKEKGFPALS